MEGSSISTGVNLWWLLIDDLINTGYLWSVNTEAIRESLGSNLTFSNMSAVGAIQDSPWRRPGTKPLFSKQKENYKIEKSLVLIAMSRQTDILFLIMSQITTTHTSTSFQFEVRIVFCLRLELENKPWLKEQILYILWILAWRKRKMWAPSALEDPPPTCITTFPPTPLHSTCILCIYCNI